MPAALLALGVASGALFPLEAARAQAPAEPPAGPQVYVDDSFEVAEAILKAQGLVERKAWSEAAETLQRILEESGEKLVQVAEGHYISVRRHVASILCLWPEDGRRAYQRSFGSIAEDRLSAAGERRDLSALLSEFDRYFCLPQAARAADALGLLALETGHFALAQRVYQRVLDEHPDCDTLRDEYRQRLNLLAAMQGREIAAADLEGSVRWKGTDRSVAVVLNDIKETFDPASDSAGGDDWLLLGGNPRRNRRGGQGLSEPGLLWQFDLAESTTTGHGLAEFAETRGSRHLARRMSAQPIVAGDRVYVQYHRDVFALHRVSGMLLWQHRGGDAAWAASEFDELAAGCDAPTLDRARLFAVLPGTANAIYGSGTRRTPPGLMCISARDGTMLWRADRDAQPTVLGDIELDASPLVHLDTVAVIGRRRRSFGFEDCYLFRFSAQSGRLLSRTHLGSASTGSFGTRQTTQSMIAADGDAIYANSNLGTVAAIVADTGEIRWLRVYPRTGAAVNREESWNAAEVEPWALNPLIVEGDGLIVLPLDSPALLWLAKEDGRLRRSIPAETLGRPQTLLGVRDGIVCTAGQQVGCYHLVEDNPVWQAPLASGLEVFGRGQWVEDELLIPTRAGVSRFRVSDGQRTDLAWSGGEAGGNLLSLSDQLFVAGVSGLTSYVRKEELWSKLREALAAAPQDPLPALDAAEVALRGGDNKEAVDYLLEAVRRADEREADLSDEGRSRIFRNLLTFAEVLKRRSDLSPETLDALFAHAPFYAPQLPGHLTYRVVFAALYQQSGRADKSLELYQQILRDRSLRGLTVAVDGQGQPLWSGNAPANKPGNADSNAPAAARTGDVPATAFAEERIAALLREHGRALYAAFEAEAQRRLESGRAARSAELLAEVAQVYPNADAALEAELARAELLGDQARFDEAAALLARAYRRSADPASSVRLLTAIIQAHARAGDRVRAYRWLTLAMRRYHDATVTLDGRASTFREYRQRFDDARPLVNPVRPDVHPPLSARFTQTFTDDVRLLSPRFADAPGFDWSRYYTASEGLVRAHDARTHRELWTQGLNTPAEVELLLARPGVAVFTTRFQIVGVEPSTGRQIWSHGEIPPAADDAAADWENFAALRQLALRGDRLLSVDDRGSMRCIDVHDGRLAWSRRYSAPAAAALDMGDNLLVFAVADDNQFLLHRLDARTGEALGAVALAEARPIERVMLTLDDRAVVLTSESIAALDPETGTSLWTVPLRGHLRPSSLLVDVDTLYFSDDGRVVRKLRLGDGRLTWESEPLSRRGETDLQIDLVDNALIVTTNDDVVALDETSGVTLWQGTAPDDVNFVRRIVGREFVAAVHQGAAEGNEALVGPIAFFYDHRDHSGALAKDGGLLELTDVGEIGEILVVDGSLVIRSGRTIHAWSAASAP